MSGFTDVLTIGIDARAAAEVPAGRGRVVRELLLALDRDPPPAVRFRLFARSRWGDLDRSRFAWTLSPLPDPLWNIATGLGAGRSCDALLSTNSYLTAWFSPLPTTLVVYDLIPWREPQTANARSARIEHLTIRPALHRADAIWCISEATRTDLAQLFPNTAGKAVAIPLAAGQEFKTSERQPPAAAAIAEPYVLAVGTIEPRKNLERLIAAWRSLDEAERSGHRLVLVGPTGWNDERWNNERILAAAKAADVLLPGHVSEPELRALYRNATAFAFPSLYEGFGLPALEAMALGTPVLTSNTSSLPEVVGDAALTVDPYDTAAIATGLARLIADSELARELRARGRVRAASFSWERTAREMVALVAATVKE